MRIICESAVRQGPIGRRPVDLSGRSSKSRWYSKFRARHEEPAAGQRMDQIAFVAETLPASLRELRLEPVPVLFRDIHANGTIVAIVRILGDFP